MGYESKFYAVKRYNHGSGTNPGYNASQIIAVLDMCKMGIGYYDSVTEFIKLFDTEADFVIYDYDYDEERECEMYKAMTEDKYGDPIKYISDIDKGIKLMREIIKEIDYYRFPYLKKFLEMFRDEEDIYICHYGY